MGVIVDKNAGGGGGGGDATAANQNLQILQLQDGSSADNVFKNIAEESVFKDDFENSVFVDANIKSVFKDFAGNSVLKKPVQIENANTFVFQITGATIGAFASDLQNIITANDGWYIMQFNFAYNTIGNIYEGILIMNDYT